MHIVDSLNNVNNYVDRFSNDHGSECIRSYQAFYSLNYNVKSNAL